MMEAGDVICVKGNRFLISRLIRWATNSQYTHVGVAMTPGFIYEIDIDKKLAIHEFAEESYDVFRCKVELTENQKQDIVSQAISRSLSNKGYDFLRILSFALEKVLLTKRSFDSANRVICSEIVDILYGDLGIDLVPDRESGHVTPAHLSQSPRLTKVFSSS